MQSWNEETVTTMRIAEPPSLDSPWRGHSGDDLDGLLHSFFRSEMPDPWPALEMPAEETVLPMPAMPRPHRWKTFRARFALAASVAFLLAGAWLIGGSLTTGARSSTPTHSGEAEIKDQPRHKKSNNGEPRIRDERLKLDKAGNTQLELQFDNDGLLPQ
jgi:hypothetical protein